MLYLLVHTASHISNNTYENKNKTFTPILSIMLTPLAMLAHSLRSHGLRHARSRSIYGPEYHKHYRKRIRKKVPKAPSALPRRRPRPRSRWSHGLLSGVAITPLSARTLALLVRSPARPVSGTHSVDAYKTASGWSSYADKITAIV